MFMRTNGKEESSTNTSAGLRNIGNRQETAIREVKYPIKRRLKSVQISWRGENGLAIGKQTQSLVENIKVRL
jgi:hypothetical protein